ncbi:unnamed protein product, partial [Protopolystoma xenopodis]
VTSSIPQIYSVKRLSRYTQTRLSALPSFDNPFVLRRVLVDMRNLMPMRPVSLPPMSIGALSSVGKDISSAKKPCGNAEQFYTESSPSRYSSWSSMPSAGCSYLAPLAYRPASTMTAILPLIRHCQKCGSQRIRFILVERPPFFEAKEELASTDDWLRHRKVRPKKGNYFFEKQVS